jgi:DNA-binding NtrC family response regulator
MNKQRVLVVDDDVALAEATSKLLNSMDYETTISGSVTSAESQLTGDTYFDLVVLDLDLGNGAHATYDLLDRLATRQIAVPPVIIFSGTPNDEVERAESRIGSHAFLRKPCSAQTLMDAIERSLNPSAKG